MRKALKPGDKVKWTHRQGASTGHVVKVQTKPTHIKDHKVSASKDHPEYIVESDKTGAKAAHLAGALKRV